MVTFDTERAAAFCNLAAEPKNSVRIQWVPRVSLLRACPRKTDDSNRPNPTSFRSFGLDENLSLQYPFSGYLDRLGAGSAIRFGHEWARHDPGTQSQGWLGSASGRK